MATKKSSRRWLDRHINDHWVELAQQQGYRSRASFKLLELQEKDELMKKGMVVVDLGAAPGGWSQVAHQLVGANGKVIASDILLMEPIHGVEFIQGDFTEEYCFQQILGQVGERKIDLVISDMAPNISGIKHVDQPRSMYLAELASDFGKKVLKEGGCFVTKLFQGEGIDTYFQDIKQSFDKVFHRKPKSSRPQSREIYLVAKHFRG